MTHDIAIKLDGGQEIGAYFSAPSDQETSPGIVLLQEIFGVNFHIRRVADMFAELGFAVLAPDLFWRVKPGVQNAYDKAGVENALYMHRTFHGWKADLHHSLPGKADLGGDPCAMEDLAKVIDHLRSLPRCNGKVAAMGYCLGGRLSVMCAANGLVDAAVSYYGTYLDLREDIAPAVRCPVLLHQPENDRWINPDANDRIERSFGKNVNVRTFVYPAVEHGFDSDQSRPVHDRWASQLANIRTVRFLDRTIGPAL